MYKRFGLMSRLWNKSLKSLTNVEISNNFSVVKILQKVKFEGHVNYTRNFSTTNKISYECPTYNSTFKGVFTDSIVMMGFLNHVLKPKDKIVQVTYGDGTLLPMVPNLTNTRGECYLDLFCKTEKGEFIVEMQRTHKSYLVKRATLYGAKKFSKQFELGESGDGTYSKLIPLYIIMIGDFNEQISEFKNNSDPITYERTQYLSFVYIELSKFKKTSVNKLGNITEKWLWYFTSAQSATSTDLIELNKNDDSRVIVRAFNILERLEGDPNHRQVYELEMAENALRYEDEQERKKLKEQQQKYQQLEEQLKEQQQKSQQVEEQLKEQLKEQQQKSQQLEEQVKILVDTLNSKSS